MKVIKKNFCMRSGKVLITQNLNTLNAQISQLDGEIAVIDDEAITLDTTMYRGMADGATRGLERARIESEAALGAERQAMAKLGTVLDSKRIATGGRTGDEIQSNSWQAETESGGAISASALLAMAQQVMEMTLHLTELDSEMSDMQDGRVLANQIMQGFTTAVANAELPYESSTERFVTKMGVQSQVKKAAHQEAKRYSPIAKSWRKLVKLVVPNYTGAPTSK